MSKSRPLIGVVSDRREPGMHYFHMLGERYLAALVLAEDGLIEAFTVRNAPGFALGVQWYPE